MFLFLQKKKKILILSVCLLSVSFLYYLSSAYINCSNDGSHFALVNAMVNKHTTEISDYVGYTAKIDYAVKDGKFYSDRLPGNAFLMTPFFLFGKCLSHFDLKPGVSWRPMEEVTVVLETNVMGVLGVFFLFLIFRHFNFSFNLSLFSALVYAVCTLNWQESTHVFSHAASMCFVLMSIYFLLRSDTIYKPTFLWSIFFLSYSAIIELQNLLLFIPVLIYVVRSKKLDFERSSQNFRRLGVSAGIALACLMILVIYNYVTFGEWMLKSSKYNPVFQEERSFLTSLSGNFVTGLDALFTNFRNLKLIFNWNLGVQNGTPGLFIISPLLLLSIPGSVLFYRKYRQEAILFLSIIVINVLIAAFHKTVLVRYIFTITPFLYFPIIFVYEYFIKSNKTFAKTTFFMIFSFLAGWSALRVFYTIHTYYGRELTDLFPFKRELPVYFIFVAFLIFAFLLVIVIRKFKPRSSKQQQ